MNDHRSKESFQRIGRGHLDRGRATRLMEVEGLDALLLTHPESIYYATGASAGNVTKARRMGAAFVLIPATLTVSPSAIIGDYYAETFAGESGIKDLLNVPIWVDTADISDMNSERMSLTDKLRRNALPDRELRPSTFDFDKGMAALATLLDGRHQRVGIEIDFLSHRDVLALQARFPKVDWIDASGLVARLRLIKSAKEIELLTIASKAAEIGLVSVRDQLTVGLSAIELVSIWSEETRRQAVTVRPNAVIETWASISIGSNAYGQSSKTDKGDLVKFDVGCVIDGYSSDSARTFSIGKASADARELAAAIEDAHWAATERLTIGTPLCEIYQAALNKMREHGFDTYRRGHFGHSCGASLFVEEWPMIGPTEAIEVDSGMVLAIEVPWYVRGLGAMMIEDQFTVTSEGAQSTWSLERGLVEI